MIRFLADADLNKDIVSGCLRREPAMDFLAANDAKLRRLPDPQVLRIAAEQNRILVSHDFRTMPRHFADFLQGGVSARSLSGQTIFAGRGRHRPARVDLERYCGRGMEEPHRSDSAGRCKPILN